MKKLRDSDKEDKDTNTGLNHDALRRRYREMYVDDPLRIDGVLPDDREAGPERSRFTRVYRRWAVGQRDLPGNRKTLLQAILLRMTAQGDPCFAGREVLMRDTGLSESTIYRHLRAAREQGLIRSRAVDGRRSKARAVIVRLYEDEKQVLQGLWGAKNRPEEPERRREWWLRHRLPTPHPRQVRFTWTRAVRDSELDTQTRGVAWAVSLLWNGSGDLYRGTTDPELAGLSGYSRRTVRDRLRLLVDRGWLFLESSRGGRNDDPGRQPWPRIPDEMIEDYRGGEPLSNR